MTSRGPPRRTTNGSKSGSADVPRAVLLAFRAAGQLVNLQRAHDALDVVRMHGGGGFGVQRPQARPKRLGCPRGRAKAKYFSRIPASAGAGRRGAAGQQQFDIQPRAARKDGQPAAGAYVPRGCGGADGEVGRGKGRVDVEDVDEMVRDARPLAAVGLAVPMSIPR